MTWQSGLILRPALKHEQWLASEDQPYDAELDRIVQTIVDSLKGEIGILSRISADELTPSVLAATGMPYRAFALAVIEDAVKRGNLNQFNGVNGQNNIRHDFFDLTISENKEGRSYFFIQKAMAYDSENLFLLSVGRQAQNNHFSPDERHVALGLFSVFFEYFKEVQTSFIADDPTDFLSFALELWDIGIMLIDNRSRIVFANTAANTLLDDGDGLRRIGQSLGASRLDDTARLQSAILFSIQGSAENRMKTDQPKVPVIALERSENRRPLIVSVVPVPPTVLRSGQSAAAVYVVDPDRDMHDSINAISQTYGLTHVEAELASNLVMGLTIVQAAKKMHIQVNTARSYLKQIFQKTMTNRQADLVRVILASSFNPVKNLQLSPL